MKWKFKECAMCKIEKQLVNNSWCKECRSKNEKEYRANLKKKKIECTSCGEIKTPYHGRKCAECKLSYMEQYYIENEDSILAYHLSYDAKNKDKINDYKNEWQKQKVKKDPLYRALVCLRARVYGIFKAKGEIKNKKTLEMVGCQLIVLEDYLQSLFQPGMTWENMGRNGWHIDHIVPLASAKSIEELEKLCHYTNLQPLWAEDNFKKGSLMPDGTKARNFNKVKNETKDS